MYENRERAEVIRLFDSAEIEDHIPQPEGFAAGTSHGLRIQGNSKEEYIESDNPLEY